VSFSVCVYSPVCSLRTPHYLSEHRRTAPALGCELDVTPRRRLGRRSLLCGRGCRWGRWGSLGWWRGILRWGCWSLRLRCRFFLWSWGRARLVCSRRWCRDRRYERLHCRWRDRWRRIGRHVTRGDWPDQRGEHRARFAGYRPALSDHRHVCASDYAQGCAYQGSDHCTLSVSVPLRPSPHR
jgi:hypothetical protein